MQAVLGWGAVVQAERLLYLLGQGGRVVGRKVDIRVLGVVQ